MGIVAGSVGRDAETRRLVYLSRNTPAPSPGLPSARATIGGGVSHSRTDHVRHATMMRRWRLPGPMASLPARRDSSCQGVSSIEQDGGRREVMPARKLHRVLA